MPRVLVTPPAAEPLTLATVKAHLRLTDDAGAEDALLNVLISAAREWAEDQTRRALITQTWQETFDRFPPCEIRLGLTPVQEITKVSYVDASGAAVDLAAAQYIVDAASLPARVRRAYGVSWPSTRDQANAVSVEFTAGYGDAPDDVPAAIRMAMLLVVGDLYANREAQIVGTIVAENPTAKALIGPYRVREAV
ncbi:MAG TPA: head-tail connector protein [Gemmatimonadaceae bacterium]|nr:head-tail connector protein [Gemmatimonadaceae bacterium]